MGIVIMQIELMLLAEQLKPGQAVVIKREDMEEAAKGSLTSLLFDSVRDSDVREFAANARRNWGVSMTENTLTKNWVMAKRWENEDGTRY